MAYFSFDQMGLNIARGLVKDLSGLNKFGFSDSINSSWDNVSIGGLYYPDVASLVSVVSASDEDKPSGTGAWTMKIEGLAVDGTEQEETITLDGTSPVVSTNEYLRVFRMFIETADTTDGAADVIVASIAGNEISRIDPEYDNQTLQAAYTVPEGKTAYITSMTISAAKDNAAVMAGLFVKDSGPNAVFSVKQIVNIFRNTTTIEFRTPIKITSLSDIVIKAKSDASNVEVSGTFNMVLENNRT
jgi:hypothetical protein